MRRSQSRPPYVLSRQPAAAKSPSQFLNGAWHRTKLFASADGFERCACALVKLVVAKKARHTSSTVPGTLGAIAVAEGVPALRMCSLTLQRGTMPRLGTEAALSAPQVSPPTGI